MTVREAILEGTARLREAGVETPYLDATVLLAFCMGVTKEHLFAEFLSSVPETTLTNFRDCLEKRERGIPVSYIRRQKEFYGRLFYVDERTLVPRPDTETVVEAALDLIDAMAGPPRADAAPRGAPGAAPDEAPPVPRILDCCTGSGCIAVTLKAERPHIDVVGSDVSAAAREVFLLNSRRILGEELTFYTSDLLQSVPGTFDLIISNPPYLRSDEVEKMRSRGWPEPPEALDGGPDGLDTVRELVEEALYSLKPYGYLVIEVADDQNDGVRHLLEDAGYREVAWRSDLAGRRRVVVGRRE
jgi:release factor glutamine methyltransferase